MSKTKAALILKGRPHPLRLDQCSFSYPVLRVSLSGAIIDIDGIRKNPGTVIEADNPEAVCRALGIPFPDSQVRRGAE
jgi:hypothetical protein